jgi:hypothetical protein
MVWRLYVIPLETGVAHPLPLYIKDIMTGYAMMAYGRIPNALVSADTDDTQHATLIANTDVVAVPDDLDQQIGAALATVRTRLEAMSIPADWVTGTDTFRTVTRSVAGVFQFAQRYSGLYASPLPIVGALDLRWSQLSTTDRQRFLDCAIDLGYDLTFVTNNTPLRQIMKALADQWGAKPFYLGGLIF